MTPSTNDDRRMNLSGESRRGSLPIDNPVAAPRGESVRRRHCNSYIPVDHPLGDSRRRTDAPDAYAFSGNSRPARRKSTVFTRIADEFSESSDPYIDLNISPAPRKRRAQADSSMHTIESADSFIGFADPYDDPRIAVAPAFRTRRRSASSASGIAYSAERHSSIDPYDDAISSADAPRRFRSSGRNARSTATTSDSRFRGSGSISAKQPQTSRNAAPARRNTRSRKRRRSVLSAMLLTVLLIALLAICAVLLLRQVPAARKQFDPYPLKYTAEVSAAAREFAVDPAYLYAIILTESSFRPDAVSNVGAQGLMQLLPETAEWISGKVGMKSTFTPDMLTDPAVNVRFGAWYLSFLLNRYDGDMRCATAAYHAGQGKVDKWLDNPAYSQDGRTLAVIASDTTDNYVNKVMKHYEKYLSLLSEAR